MSLEAQSFEFGEFVLDADEKVLLRNGKPTAITPKVFDLLLFLVQNHGHLIEKKALMEKVWADSFVEESNLTFSIRQLRKILGDGAHNSKFIETIPKRGYRFIGKIEAGNIENGGSEKTNASLVPVSVKPPLDGWSSRPVFLSILAILSTTVLLSAGFFIWRGEQAGNDKAFFDADSPLKFETVVSSDRPMTAAISSDGKYIAYSRTTNGLQSLWVRQSSSGVDTQVVDPEDGIIYLGMKFSGSGEYIYFSRRLRDEPAHIDRVSILGGTTKVNILKNVDGAFSISPNDRLISFRRYEPEKRSLLIANIDGSNTRQIFETTKTFTDNIFSPDGKTIAFASGQSGAGDQDFSVYTIDVENGKVKPATDFKWHHVRGVVWLPDQSGLLVTARIKNDDPQQLWRISLPTGEVKKITNTQNDFGSISATRDFSRILLMQSSLSSNLDLASSAAFDNVQPVTPASAGIVWTHDGDLIYTSASGGNSDIWLLKTDRKNQKQLTTENSADFNPRISPDGRYIVFVSDRAGKNNIWRINADGSSPVKLTDGDGEKYPAFMPDGQFVVFNSAKDGALWKVPIEGGEPTQISGKRQYNVSISPDGTTFAHFTKVDGEQKLVIKSFEDDEVLKVFDTPAGLFTGREIVWPKNGKFLLYAAEDSNNVGNLWRQPLNGGSPEKFTNYTSEEIFYFDFSLDGSEIALVRGLWNHDVVLATAPGN